MDVSFSAWRHSREESLQLKGDSFSFLFDRRYTNRLNRMSRVFFEAYVVATKELAAQEDRFPSLSEIDAKMESGAVYAFKDRLMKNTEFFEEVKISGVSYLVPRALKFVDVSGTYTDLILNFEEGIVVLPTRRKTPLFSDSPMPIEERRAKNILTWMRAQIKRPPLPKIRRGGRKQKQNRSRILCTHRRPSRRSPRQRETAEAASPSEPAEKIVVTATSPAKEPYKPPLTKKKMAMPPKTVTLLGAAILLALVAVVSIYWPNAGTGTGTANVPGLVFRIPFQFQQRKLSGPEHHQPPGNGQ